MSDTIFLRAMEFEGRHGVSDEERADAQVIEVDIEYELDLRPAGTSDDLAQTVIPFPRLGMGEFGIGLHVGFRSVEAHRLDVFEVRINQRQLVGSVLVERPQHRVTLAQEKPAAGAQQLRHHVGPATDVG